MEIHLKEMRRRAGMSQADVAEKLGVKLRTYGSWERGEANMSIEQAAKCAVILNCSIDEIAGMPLHDPSSFATERERELHQHYGHLSDEGREVAVNVVGALATSYPRPSPENLGGGASMPSPNAPA